MCVFTHTHRDKRNPQDKLKKKIGSNFATMPGFELHLEADAEHLKNFQKLEKTWDLPIQEILAHSVSNSMDQENRMVMTMRVKNFQRF